MEKKEKKDNKLKILIIICAVIYVLFAILPFALVFIGLFLESKTVDFKTTNDGNVEVKEIGLNIKMLDSYYDKDDNCYYVSTKIDRDKSKKITKDSLDMSLTFKDKDGYVLGDGTLFISDLSKETKWKINASFCDQNAKDVDSYEVKEITLYS